MFYHRLGRRGAGPPDAPSARRRVYFKLQSIMFLKLITGLPPDLDGAILRYQRVHKVNADRRQMRIGEAERVTAIGQRPDRCSGFDADDAEAGFDLVEGRESGVRHAECHDFFIKFDSNVLQNTVGVGSMFINGNSPVAILVDDCQHLVDDGDAWSEVHGNVDAMGGHGDARGLQVFVEAMRLRIAREHEQQATQQAGSHLPPNFLP